jgi:phospholipase C
MYRSMWMQSVLSASAALALFTSCVSDDAEPAIDEIDQAATTSAIKTIFVITMENRDDVDIYGNTADAPYLNGTLMAQYGHSSRFGDVLPTLPSEPHYLWMEAGTNRFADHTFTGDGAPSSTNSTADTAHIATQIKNATNGVSWMSYQEGINWLTGACPIGGWGQYAPKHNPFVFFRDVAGSPPSRSNAYCAAHHKELAALATDLKNRAVASYNFITPNLCNDMHGNLGCPDSNAVRAGDTWLRNNLPPLIAYANANAGVIFIVWDEGEGSQVMPFFAIGPHVKAGYTSTVAYDHSSLVKSIEEILGLPVLSRVSAATDFADFFEPGFFP